MAQSITLEKPSFQNILHNNKGSNAPEPVVGGILQVRLELKAKECARCGKSFSQKSPYQRFCGSIIEKSGCSFYHRTKERDRNKTREYNFTCQYCGRKPPNVELQIDHILARANGGKSKITNLTVACKECNVGKCDLLLDQSLEDFSS
jgi:5-methylcytosine-specific restriction endonuclease McrA